MNARQLYRRLYRELSSQHLRFAKEEAEKEVKKLALVNKIGYKGEHAPSTPVPLKSTKYATKDLRELFKESADISYGIEAMNFLKNQQNYKSLLIKYNSSLTMTEEQKIHLSAKRVGLELPQDGS